MTKAEKYFYKITKKLTGGKVGKMFGALCVKNSNGKAVAIFWKGEMMFKLKDETARDVLKLKGTRTGTHIYDTSKPMKGWVWVPFEHSGKWKKFIEMAIGQT